MSLKKIPKLNGGSESISVSLPGWELEIIDHVCELKTYSRSTFFQKAARRLMLEELDEPDLWELVYRSIKDES